MKSIACTCMFKIGWLWAQQDETIMITIDICIKLITGGLLIKHPKVYTSVIHVMPLIVFWPFYHLWQPFIKHRVTPLTLHHCSQWQLWVEQNFVIKPWQPHEDAKAFIDYVWAWITCIPSWVALKLSKPVLECQCANSR